MKEVTIKLIGQLDLDLTKRGMRAGEVHKGILYENGKVEFFDSRIDNKYPVAVYSGNYEKVEIAHGLNRRTIEDGDTILVQLRKQIGSTARTPLYNVYSSEFWGIGDVAVEVSEVIHTSGSTVLQTKYGQCRITNAELICKIK